jgi:cell division septum initiation protein DivIVA
MGNIKPTENWYNPLKKMDTRIRGYDEFKGLAKVLQKIRQEGVERAQREADALIAAAKQQATEIVQTAELRRLTATAAA